MFFFTPCLVILGYPLILSIYVLSFQVVTPKVVFIYSRVLYCPPRHPLKTQYPPCWRRLGNSFPKPRPPSQLNLLRLPKRLQLDPRLNRLLKTKPRDLALRTPQQCLPAPPQFQLRPAKSLSRKLSTRLRRRRFLRGFLFNARVVCVYLLV